MSVALNLSVAHPAPGSPQIDAAIYSSPTKARSRALSLALAAAAKPAAPLLDIPTELGIEILQFGLAHASIDTLASVSRAFRACIDAILYKHVLLRTPKAVSLFARTARQRPDLVRNLVKRLAVAFPWGSSPATSIDIEYVIAACSGVRILSLPRPGLIASPCLSRTLPSELTLQSFDFTRLDVARCSAHHLSTALTHLRISEPGDAWYAPSAIISFFGDAPHLTHIALARRMEANEDNDAVFVADIQTILASRPQLRMVVVRIFPAHFPLYYNPEAVVEDSAIWQVLSVLAEEDPRLVIVAAGFDRGKATSWVQMPNDGFWDKATATK
ncbi:hypothetical protein MKEN_01425100 [Mycena kentingensis (nom. inval.)]|nr:hypothetical protein MKEN_01425100 [Mycena kentingensis (nom. inval.)]